MNLTDIFKEIKIQNPNSIRLTDKGKSAIEDIASLRVILQNLVEESAFQEVFTYAYQTEYLYTADFLNICVSNKWIYIDKPTTIEHFSNKINTEWGGSNPIDDLKTFLKYKLIHPLNLK
jgi:hypothetical protein